MKNYQFSFTTYKNKVKALPGFLIFLIILLFIVLIPIIFVLVLGIGLAFMIVSGIIGLFIPSRKKVNSNEEGNGRIIEIFEEK